MSCLSQKFPAMHAKYLFWVSAVLFSLMSVRILLDDTHLSEYLKQAYSTKDNGKPREDLNDQRTPVMRMCLHFGMVFWLNLAAICVMFSRTSTSAQVWVMRALSAFSLVAVTAGIISAVSAVGGIYRITTLVVALVSNVLWFLAEPNKPLEHPRAAGNFPAGIWMFVVATLVGNLFVSRWDDNEYAPDYVKEISFGILFLTSFLHTSLAMSPSVTAFQESTSLFPLRLACLDRLLLIR